MAPDFAALRKTKDEWEERLLGLPGVVAVGIGPKRVGGRDTGEVGIVVSVAEKVSKADLAPDEMVPETLDDVPTDVVQTGRAVLKSEGRGPYPNPRRRPVTPGVPIEAYLGSSNFGEGTLGAFVTDGKSVFALSNNHVLCQPRTQKRGGTVIQPSRDYGGTAKDKIGVVTHSVPFDISENWADCAMAKISGPSSLISPRYPGVGILRGHYNKLGWRWKLVKQGGTTLWTEGIITSVAEAVWVDTDNGKLLFRDQVKIEGKLASRGGDSGSLWVTEDKYAAALLFAGPDNDDTIAWASPINTVLGTFRVKIWTGYAKGPGPLGVDGEDHPDGVFGGDDATIERLRAGVESEPRPLATRV